jgi:hypothetical protein
MIEERTITAKAEVQRLLDGMSLGKSSTQRITNVILVPVDISNTITNRRVSVQYIF